MQRQVIVFMLMLCWPLCTWGAVTLDQYQWTSGGSRSLGTGTAYMKAQTFTAGLSGTLDHVNISLDRTSVAMIMQIREVASNGTPSDSILGSYNLSDSVYGWNSFYFNTQNIQMTSGEQYAIVFWKEVSDSQYLDVIWDGDSYAGGQAWQMSSGQWELMSLDDGNGADLLFSTYVDILTNGNPTVPVPGALLLASIGSGVLGYVRRRSSI